MSIELSGILSAVAQGFTEFSVAVIGCVDRGRGLGEGG